MSNTATLTAPPHNTPSPERACHVASPAALPLPPDFSLPMTHPDQTPLDLSAPACDSLQLKKTLTTLHLQTLSMQHASLALAKLVELTDSKKPEVARRACMTLLKLAHLDHAKNLIPDTADLFNEEDNEPPAINQKSKTQNQKSPPPTIETALTWTLPAPPAPPAPPSPPPQKRPGLTCPAALARWASTPLAASVLLCILTFAFHVSSFAFSPPLPPQCLSASVPPCLPHPPSLTLESPHTHPTLRIPMPFTYEPTIQLTHDDTPYRKLTSDFVSTATLNGQTYTHIAPEAFRLLAREAFNDISFYLRTAHLKRLREELDDPEASDNDRFVIYTHLQNAVTASAGLLPTCQDTGTAIVMGKKGQRILTTSDDAQALSQGIYDTYQERNLRYSQIAPLEMFTEKNTATNLPAQFDLYADATAEHADEYAFLFIAKGGGSANKSYLYQQTPALLNEDSLLNFIKQKLKDIGTSACPPYHLAVVIGGTSAETTLKTVKLASTGYYDSLPTTGSPGGRAFRDLDWEKKVYTLCTQSGIGAQFGGKYFAHDVRVIRMPRHAASCPVGIGVSCSADRNIKAKITKDGIFLEQLERHPEQFLPAQQPELAPPVNINLNLGMDKVRAILTKFPVKTRLSLTGTIIVARDVAHARIKQLLDAGQPMPDYFKNFPIYYAGPAKTPPGMPSGSFGPTTAGRMDTYMEQFQAAGGSLISLAKGNRSPAVTDACKKHGGFYLGSIGGPAAILAQNNIKKVEVVDFEDLGMEAIRKIEVENFPAFIVVDDKGNDFFVGLT